MTFSHDHSIELLLIRKKDMSVSYDNYDTPYTDKRKECKTPYQQDIGKSKNNNDSSSRKKGYNSKRKKFKGRNKRHDNHYFEPSSSLEAIFFKKYEFKDDEDNPISVPPSVDDIFNYQPFSIDILMRTKEDLNQTRSKLDQFDISKWSKHTYFTNRSGKIVRSIRTKIRPELCTIAWVKMYEIISTYPDLIPFDEYRIHSVHICEAPGAFICSINHYIKTKRSYIEWNWTGNSLNPHFEGNDLQSMIDDDRFINETFDHWNFGKDNSGNIMNIENIRDLWTYCKDLPVFLVTSDGSVDCQHVPNEQEHHTAPLHYCEMVCALGLLKRGGGFVIKLFNLFEHSTAGMLYILKAHFEKLHVFKPVTSKSGNSETYAIAIGFRGIENTLLEKLLSYVNDNGRNIFNEFCLIPKEKMSNNFIDQLCECSMMFANFQHKAIKENIELWNDGMGMSFEEKQIIINEKEWVTNQWFNHYSITLLDSHYFITSTKLSGNRLKKGRSLNPKNSKISGSLHERKNTIQERISISAGSSVPRTPLNEQNNSLSDFELLEMAETMGIDVNDLVIDYREEDIPIDGKYELGFHPTSVQSYRFSWSEGLVFHLESRSQNALDLENYSINIGTPVKEIKYSKFCKEDILVKYKACQNLLRSKFISPSQLIEAGQKAYFPYFLIQNEIFKDYPHIDSIKFHEVMNMTLTNFKSDSCVVLSGTNEHIRNTIEKDKQIFKGLYVLENCCQQNFYNDSISAIHDIKEKIGSVGLFIGDLSWPEELFLFPTSENKFHSSVLREIFVAISTLSPGGSLILRFVNCITRYSCNILYILYHLFSTLIIMKPVFSSPITNERIVVAQNLKEISRYKQIIISRIEEVLKKTSELNDNEVIYDFICPLLLSEPYFFNFILKTNDQLLMREVEAIYSLIDSIENEIMPFDEQKSLLIDIFENINLKSYG